MNSFELSEQREVSPSLKSCFNHCVAGETPILTKKGYFPIIDLQDKLVEVWNGNEWSEVTVKQTAPRRHLITVFFSNGRSLTCTPDHKFIISANDVSSDDNLLKHAKRVPAQFLTPGMKLRQEELPVVEGEELFLYPYLHGAMCSFGCFTEQGPIIDIMGPALTSIINHPDMIITDTGAKVFPDNLPAPYLVPINCSVEVKLQWLAGFFDARAFGSKIGMTMISVNDKLLQDAQLLLTTLGAYSFMEHNENVKVPLPGGKSVSICNYGLVIPWEQFEKLRKLGLTGIYSQMQVPKESNTIPLVIREVVDIGRMSPTYCFSETKNNAGIFNGILTGQCSEINSITINFS